VQDIEGSGAAGGLGGGAIALLGASLKRGFEIINKEANLEKKIQWADVIISGEGKLDAQSFEGKVVGSIFELTQKWDKPLIVLCGNISEMPHYQNLKLSPFSIAQGAMSLQEMKKNAYVLLKSLSYNIGKILFF
jgi:glycerate kinase